jgi:hypothetical protein
MTKTLLYSALTGAFAVGAIGMLIEATLGPTDLPTKEMLTAIFLGALTGICLQLACRGV